MPSNSINRSLQFLRSLLPTDAKQLLFIVGLVCLTVVPHLNWLPSDDASFFGNLFSAENTSVRRNWFAFVSIASCTFLFATCAGFFVLAWPGKRPARRISLLVVLPVLVGLGTICFRYLSLLASPSSVLQKGFAFEHGPVWMITGLLRLGTAFHFCVAGLCLVVVFALLLAQGKAALPVSIALQNAQAIEDTDAWRGCKRVIWIFQGAHPLAALPLGLFSALRLLIPARNPVTWQYEVWRAIWPISEGAVFFGIAIWMMGEDNWKFIRRQLQLPTLRHAALGLAIPALPALLLPLAMYLFNRADWAAHAFGRLDPPRLEDYLPTPEVWMATLFLAAFAEEVIFRGVLQKHFIERFGLWRGIAFVGIIWAAFHFYGDGNYRLNDLGVAAALSVRLIACVIHGFGLSWLTLRSKSLLPATLAHGLYNIFVYSRSEFHFPGEDWVQLGLWALLVFALFRYWPVDTTPVELPTSATEVVEPAV